MGGERITNRQKDISRLLRKNRSGNAGKPDIFRKGPGPAQKKGK